MTLHARTRAGVTLGFAVVVALTSTGCLYPPTVPYSPWPAAYSPAYPPPSVTPSRTPPASPADKSAAQFPDNRTAGVVQAQYQQPAPPGGVAAQAPAPAAAPATPPGAANPPARLPNQLPGSTPLPYPQPVADPHTRGTPTNSGAALNLAPNEMPIDRAVELSRRIDAFAFENQRLADRIKALEAKADEREHAIDESLREVETSTAEVVRTRADLKAVRREIDGLRERMRAMENDEIETLKKVIDALEKLLQSGEQP